MQTSLEIVVELKLGRACVLPDVRFWTDPGFSGDLRSELEVDLELRRRWCWHGALTIEHSRPCFFYRLGISAFAGVDWTLRIHDRSSARDILVDEDCITTPKCWLLGSCDLRRPIHGGSEVDCDAMRHLRAIEPADLESAAPASDGNVVVLAQRRRHL